MRSHIAYFSPMPPERSGISDYSVELLEHLTKLVDVDTYAGVSETTTFNGWTLRPYEAYPILARRQPYDLNVYAMGNNYEFHDEIFDLALREPGLVVMHDLTLYGFYFMGTGARRDLLANEVRYAHGERALAEWRTVADDYTKVDRLKFNMLRRIAERSRGIIVHSEWGRDRLREIAPAVPVYVVPLGTRDLTDGNRSDSDATRAKLHIKNSPLVAGVFGHVEPEKRVTQIVEAFSDVVKITPSAHLLIVGRSVNVPYRERLEALIRTTKLKGNVTIVDSPPLADFERMMQACDVILNLRWPSSGENSAVMARAFGMGKPVVTSDVPQFRELSDQFCWRIPYEGDEERQRLASLLLRVAKDRDLLIDARLAAQEYVRDIAGWDAVARRYTDAIAELAAQHDASQDDTPYTANPLRQTSGVNCIGDITAEVGLGTAAHQMMRSIMEEGIPSSFIEFQFPSPSRDLSALELVEGLPKVTTYPTNLLFCNINEMHHISDEEMVRLTAGRYTVARWAWELTKLSDAWVKRIDRLDELWVVSKFTQESFQAVTDKPVIVIPNTIDVSVSPTVSRTYFGLPEDRFIYFFGFAATSTEARKNPFAVVRAFKQAFGRPSGKNSPYLVIKAHYVDEFPELLRDLKKELAEVGGRLITENFTRQETNDLLSSIDCYVSLHRAEGFALGPAEAMFLGKPVIATAYSGNMDFMTPDNSYLVDYKVRPITEEDHIYHKWGHLVYQTGMEWAEPDVAHAAEQMRHVYERPEEAAERGARAASDIRAQYSHEAVGRLIRKRLAQIERERPPMTKVLKGADTQLVVAPTAGLLDSLQRHSEAIASLEWSRTRDKAVPFGKVKKIGTLPRILARVLVQGRINERQQWINTYTHQEIGALVGEFTALKQQAAALNEQSAAMKEQVTALTQQKAIADDTQQALISYMMRYGSAMSAIAERAPELVPYTHVSLTEDIDGKFYTRLSALPQDQFNPFVSRAPAKTTTTAQRAPIAWYHAAMSALQDDRAAFFHQMFERLPESDILVLLSNAEPTTALDVGSLHVVYDGLMPNMLRATVVRHPRIERRAHALGYDVYVNADSHGNIADTERADTVDTQWLRRRLKAGSVFVDIGAGFGAASILAARIVGPTGKVIAVEPDPIKVHTLRQSKALLPHPENLTVIHGVAGEINGTTRFDPTSSRDDASASSHCRIGITTPMRRMDGVLAGVPHVDVLKLSMNDLNAGALRSMEAIIRRDRPLVLTDYWFTGAATGAGDASRNRNDLRDLLTELGYRFDLLHSGADGVAQTARDAVAAGPQVRRALATIGTGAMASLLDSTLPTFEAYAQRHGYSVVVGDGDSAGRPTAWGKVLLLRKLLDQFDEVLWIDADAVILDDRVDLATLVEPSAYQALARTSTNEGLVPNSGVWFLRGERARQLLDAIWKNETYVYHKWWENAALIDLLGYCVTPPVMPVQPSEWLTGTQWLPNEWNAIPPWDSIHAPRIRHYAGLEMESRRRGIARDLREAGLAFKIACYPTALHDQANGHAAMAATPSIARHE
ncbi:MAG TPA: FkbM family methyltransferase [Ktedonobacterales bacterium]